MKNIIKTISIFLILLFGANLLRKCTKSSDTIEVTKTDTIVKVVNIPFIINDTVIKIPKPIKEYIYINNSKELIYKLSKKYNKKVDSLMLINELLELNKVKEYREQLKDSLITVNVAVKSTGDVKSISIDYFKKPQLLKYKEVTTTITKLPLFRVYAGLNTDFNNSTLNLSLQNKKGYIYELGYNTQNKINIGFKIPLFTKY